MPPTVDARLVSSPERIVVECGRVLPGHSCAPIGDLVWHKSRRCWQLVRDYGYMKRSDGAYDLVKAGRRPYAAALRLPTIVVCRTCQFRNSVTRPD
jgi:hypothetical protein